MKTGIKHEAKILILRVMIHKSDKKKADLIFRKKAYNKDYKYGRTRCDKSRRRARAQSNAIIFASATLTSAFFSVIISKKSSESRISRSSKQSRSSGTSSKTEKTSWRVSSGGTTGYYRKNGVSKSCRRG